jgi:hypothetical protein
MGRDLSRLPAVGRRRAGVLQVRREMAVSIWCGKEVHAGGGGTAPMSGCWRGCGCAWGRGRSGSGDGCPFAGWGSEAAWRLPRRGGEGLGEGIAPAA